MALAERSAATTASFNLHSATAHPSLDWGLTGRVMRGYRAFIVGPDGHIKDRFEFWAEDDEMAKDHARQYVDEHDVEVWCLAERIAVLKSKQ